MTINGSKIPACITLNIFSFWWKPSTELNDLNAILSPLTTKPTTRIGLMIKRFRANIPSTCSLCACCIPHLTDIDHTTKGRPRCEELRWSARGTPPSGNRTYYKTTRWRPKVKIYARIVIFLGLFAKYIAIYNGFICIRKLATTIYFLLAIVIFGRHWRATARNVEPWGSFC